MKEALVEMVESNLTLKFADETETLTPIPSSDTKPFTEIDVLSFEISGKPGAHVHFFMSGDSVRGLYYEDKRGGNEKVIVAIAAPKFLGLDG
jgi:hypothetical protein